MFTTKWFVSRTDPRLGSVFELSVAKVWELSITRGGFGVFTHEIFLHANPPIWGLMTPNGLYTGPQNKLTNTPSCGAGICSSLLGFRQTTETRTKSYKMTFARITPTDTPTKLLILYSAIDLAE